MNIEVSSSARALSVAYKDAPALVHTTVTRVMQRLVGRLHSYVLLRKLSGNPLQPRTRNLARALFTRVELSGQALVGRVGFDHAKAAYARIHELGGRIVPKNGRFLTIPVGEALTPGGVPRFDAREFIERTKKGGGGIQGFTASFVNANYTAIMGVRRVAGGGRNVANVNFEPVFLLRRSVVLPARRPLGETLDENRDEIRQAFETGVVEVVQRLRQVG